VLNAWYIASLHVSVSRYLKAAERCLHGRLTCNVSGERIAKVAKPGVPYVVKPGPQER
jgi:hypothetical protein